MTTGPGIAKAAAPAPTVLGVPVSLDLLDSLSAVAIACKREGVTIETWFTKAWEALGR